MKSKKKTVYSDVYSTAKVFLHYRVAASRVLSNCFLNDLSVKSMSLFNFYKRKTVGKFDVEVTCHKIYRRYASILIYPLCGFNK